MKGLIPPDPETGPSAERVAVVRRGRGERKRVAAACLEFFDAAEDAIAHAAGQPHLRPVRVLGPSKSSEGQFVYYVLEWLDEA